MVGEAIFCNYLSAQNVLLICGHNSCRYQLAQRCPAAGIIVIGNAIAIIYPYISILGMHRLKIDIHRGLGRRDLICIRIGAKFAFMRSCLGGARSNSHFSVIPFSLQRLQTC